MYVTRNEEEDIISTSATIQYEGQEWVDDDDKEMKCYACSLSNRFIKNCPNGKSNKVLKCCKTKQKSTIQNSWQEEVNAGFTYGDSIFDFDDTTLGIVGARLALNEAISSPTTADLTFYDRDKNAVVFQNKQAFKEFCISFISGRDEKDKKRIQKKININNAQSQEDVEAVTW